MFVRIQLNVYVLFELVWVDYKTILAGACAKPTVATDIPNKHLQIDIPTNLFYIIIATKSL